MKIKKRKNSEFDRLFTAIPVRDLESKVWVNTEYITAFRMERSKEVEGRIDAFIDTFGDDMCIRGVLTEDEALELAYAITLAPHGFWTIDRLLK